MKEFGRRPDQPDIAEKTKWLGEYALSAYVLMEKPASRSAEPSCLLCTPYVVPTKIPSDTRAKSVRTEDGRGK